MLNKKKPAIAGTRTKQDSLKKSKKKVVKPSKSKNKNKDKTKNRDKSSNIGNENPIPLPPLPLPSANTTDILKIPPGTNNIQSPSQANNPSLKPIDNNSAVTPVWFHNSAAVTNIDISSGTTPNDIPTIEDPDRTSPIDTLSMPLMEFGQQQQQQEGTPSRGYKFTRRQSQQQLNTPGTKRVKRGKVWQGGRNWLVVRNN